MRLAPALALVLTPSGLIWPLMANAGTLETSAGPMQVAAVLKGLEEPWGLA